MTQGEDGRGGTERSQLAEGLPIERYPGLRAGDFAAGEGVLGIAAAPKEEPVGWGDDAGPKDPLDMYEWMRRLSDQGIASEYRDGKIRVFVEPDPRFGWRAVQTVESFDTDPATWSHIPTQDLSHPVIQDLNVVRKALDYLRQYPGGSSVLDYASRTPVIMIPGAADRYMTTVDPRQPVQLGDLQPAGDPGVVYWDPRNGLQVSPFALQSPAMQLFHEFGHVQRYRTHPGDRFTPGTFFGDLYTPLSNGYDNVEEERNITQVEAPAARAWESLRERTTILR